jgi:D-alanyl-lipoteichoic acid acyltransferase DltB (MBOAT superfamily)
VSEKSGVMKENCWTVVLVVVHRVYYSHFIISLKKYDMVARTFLYIIILFFINKLNSSMSNFGGRLSQPKKIKLFLGISFFLLNSTGGGFLILKQIYNHSFDSADFS